MKNITELEIVDIQEETPEDVVERLMALKSEIDDVLSILSPSDDEFKTGFNPDEENFELDDEPLELDYGDNEDDELELNLDFDDDIEQQPELDFSIDDEDVDSIPNNFDDDFKDDEEDAEIDFDQDFANDEDDTMDFAGGDFDSDFDQEQNSQEESPDFQGEIRTVAGANLVYKRKAEDGNYEELWLYNIGRNIKKETQIRRAILAGTDIEPSERESEDGMQKAETTSIGNVQFLHITGLPN